jgi:hypothetical protein
MDKKPGIRFTFEEELANVPLWQVKDGTYKVFIKKEIDTFKNGERAVKTSRGFISVNNLFRYADTALKALFFIDGSFVLNTEIELEIVMSNRNVVGIKKV